MPVFVVFHEFDENFCNNFFKKIITDLLNSAVATASIKKKHNLVNLFNRVISDGILKEICKIFGLGKSLALIKKGPKKKNILFIFSIVVRNIQVLK